MRRDRTLVLVMAGGAGGRLQDLTADRAKPAVPYGGSYRLIDFPLSNCLHSELSDVWVIEQFNSISIADHLQGGRPWDLDRTYGGLMFLPPRQGQGGEGFSKGTADALWRNVGPIREVRADHLLVLSADAVYTMDYADVLAAHRETGADVTVVTKQIDGDARRYGVVQVDGDRRITDYAYKPEKPASDLIANEVFVFSAGRALDLLEELGEGADPEEGIGDFGDAMLPRLVDEGSAREFRFDGYWRDLGTVPAYWEAHQDLLAEEPELRLDDPSWPLLTFATNRPPARVRRGAEVADSLISPGCTVQGRVERSVLSPGVVVEQGAVVCGSVLLHDVVVRRGATVEQAVLDERVIVGRDARVGQAGARSEGEPAITLIARATEIEPGATVRAE